MAARNERPAARSDVPVPGAVTISTTGDSEPPAEVVCEQAAPIIVRPPRPRWSTIDRAGRIGIPSYDGQDPYELIITVRLDGYPRRSVEDDIATLEGFAEVPDGRDQPPVLTVEGAIPRPHPNLKWRMTAIDDPSDQVYLPGGKSRCRYVTAVTLMQHVVASSLAESLQQTKGSTGLRTRTTRVRSGEADLFAVARRYYGDPSRASDIARANFSGGHPLTLGGTLTAGTQLRMPA